MATMTTTIIKQAAEVEIPNNLKESVETVKKQIVPQSTSRQQSLEFVQVLLLVAVSSIMELRNLLPFDGFEDRDIHTIRKDIKSAIFDDFGNMSLLSDQSSPAKRARTTKRFKIVNRKASAATEKLYTWFDGIFHGISHEYIDSIQMSIIAEKHKPEHVLESYLFSLRYNTGSQGKQDIGVSLSSFLNTKPVTVTRARSSIYSVMKHLGQLLRTLPDLPENRYLTFNLFFTGKRPTNFNPIGFKASNQTTMLVPDSTEWKMQMTAVGSAELGSHDVEVKVAYLATLDSVIQEDSSTYRIPSKLPYNKLLSRTSFGPILEGNILLPKKNPFGTRSRASTPSTAPARRDSPSGLVIQSLQAEASQIGPLSIQAESISPRPDKQAEHGPNSLSTRDRLLAMICSQSIKSRATQSQDVTMLETDGEMPTWMLISFKDDELYTKREQFLAQPGFISSQAKIRCECGVNIKEGGMISCDCCDRWQHKHCHALDRAPEDILGNTHVCYDCLLNSTDMDLLSNLQDAARLRRICWMIRANGLSIPKEMLVKKLGYKEEDTLIYLGALSDAGLIGISGGMVKLDDKATDTNFENHEVLHPLSHISHLFECVSSGGTDSSPPHGQKRGMEDDQVTQSSDSQDLDAMVPNKKRKAPNLPSTPRRHVFPFYSSMEAQSPIAGGGDI